MYHDVAFQMNYRAYLSVFSQSLPPPSFPLDEFIRIKLIKPGSESTVTPFSPTSTHQTSSKMDSAFVLPHPASMGASCILGLLLLTILRALLIPKKALPLTINHHRWDIFNRRAIQDFTANPQDLVKAGLKKVISKIASRFEVYRY
jgi:hypothetical protein